MTKYREALRELMESGDAFDSSVADTPAGFAAAERWKTADDNARKLLAEPPLSGEPVAWQERQLRGPNEWSSWYGINKQPPRNYAAHNYQWRALYTREYP